MYTGFLKAAPDQAAQQNVLAMATSVDDFHICGRELYWLCRKKLGESEVSGPLVGKALRVQATLRNATTVRKIAAKYS